MSDIWYVNVGRRDDKVVEEIFGQQKMKNGRKMQTLKTSVNYGS